MGSSICIRSPPLYSPKIQSLTAGGEPTNNTTAPNLEIPLCPIPIDVDALEDLADDVATAITSYTSMQNKSKQTRKEQQCCRIRVDLPPGKSPHTSYPFGMHDKLGDPWDYAVTSRVLVLRSKGCTTNSQLNSERCWNCEMLTNNPNLVYHSIGGLVTLVRRKQGEVKALRLRKLNDACKLAGKAVAIDDLKRWVMAVGSGRVERVDRLVRVNLARKGGIRNLLDLYDRAAQQIYHPRNYRGR
ncbi:hypothetical protein L208DRAFT_1411474 [Tricholoma matsutake]|nr:hypothetical protein L208DRAFT_1411474 [Tricholoma matsutake 945]